MTAQTLALASVAANGFNIATIQLDNARSLRDVANGFSQSEVDAMIASIERSFAERDLFEGANAVSSTSSYSVGKNKVIANKVAVARFFLALNIRAENVILRKVSASAMFNAKALKKVVELAQFVVTGATKIEMVMKAFIVCALAFDARSNGDAIANRFNKSFLSSMSFDKIVSDTELAEYIADYQHKFMTGGKDTQSSQARNVLDVLGLGSIESCENRYRGGIRLASDHAFYALFTDAFVK